jgi:hypothetical protein
LQDFARRFPGFSHHVLGVALNGSGKTEPGYRVSCTLPGATTVAGGSAAAWRAETGIE